MLRIILIYGIIGGIIVAVPMAVSMRTTTAGTIPENAALYGYLSMLLAFTMVFVGIKHYRDKVLGGVIRFLPALGVGLGISAVASLFWVVGWEATLASGFDFGGAYTDSVVAAAQARGAGRPRSRACAPRRRNSWRCTRTRCSVCRSRSWRCFPWVC